LKVIFNVTERCNLSCRHCYAEEFKHGRELSREEALGVVEEVAGLFGRGVKLILSGGEPLLREDLYDIASYAARLGLEVSVATNATLVDEEAAERLRRSGVSEVSVSLDSATPTLHDQLRGEGAYEKALRGLRLCRRAGLRVVVCPCVSSLNVHEAGSILDLAEREGAAGVRVFHFLPMGRGEGLDGLMDSSSFERWLWALGREQARRPRLAIRTTQAPMYTVVLRRLADQGLDGPISQALEDLTPGCRAGVATLSIKASGDVVPCPLWPLSVGNLRSTTLKEAWSSSLLERLRSRSGYRGRCGSCRFLSACGGCRVRAYLVKGGFFEEDPLCQGLYEPR